jgi:nucleoside 2-deoxyribosyltransferase
MAGPLFSTAETSFNVQLAGHLRRLGHEIFLPQEHEQDIKNPGAIFRSDREGILWAEMVLANLDGPDPDSGTCWELGFGYAKGKNLVVYRTDFRLFEGADKINLMMTESADIVIIAPMMDTIKLAETIDAQIAARWPVRGDGNAHHNPRYKKGYVAKGSIIKGIGRDEYATAPYRWRDK